MAASESSIIIQRDIKSVFSVADTYPLFVDFYFNKQILSGKGNSEHKVRMCARFFGNLTFCWEGIRTKRIEGSEIEWVQSQGLLKGLRATWSFAPRNGGTLVVLKCSYNCSVIFFGPILSCLANLIFIRKTLSRLLFSLKVTCEKLRTA